MLVLRREGVKQTHISSLFSHFYTPKLPMTMSLKEKHTLLFGEITRLLYIHTDDMDRVLNKAMFRMS